MHQIDIGKILPKNAVTQKMAFIGRTGSGKTYGAGKLAEEFYKIGVQFIVLDPVGVWWGLRLSSNGKKEGIPIPVFGGLHGDIPIEPTAGKLFADLIIDKKLCAVLDISQFEHNIDKARFAEDFSARFFFKKKANPSAIHLFIEEAQEFIPQNPSKGEERMLGSFERLWKLGRNFGVGGSLISQRPQEVNKKALNQTECLFAFQMTGTHERKAIEAWISDKGIDEDITQILPKLEIGEVRIWSPQWLKISETIKIKKKETFNASSTPEIDEKGVKTKTLAPIELEKIREEMKETISRANADNPKLLKKRIFELEKDLRGTPKIIPQSDKDIEKKLSQRIDLLEKERNQLIDRLIKLKKWWKSILIDESLFDPPKMNELQKPVIAITRSTGAFSQLNPIKIEPIIKILEKREIIDFDNGKRFGICEKKILSLLFNNSNRSFSQKNVAVFTGYAHNSGSFKNSLSQLKSSALIQKNGEQIQISEGGMKSIPDILGRDINLFQTFNISNWSKNLGLCERKIFNYLLENQGNKFMLEDIGNSTGYIPSSGSFKNAISRLNSLALIKKQGSQIEINPEILSEF